MADLHTSPGSAQSRDDVAEIDRDIEAYLKEKNTNGAPQGTGRSVDDQLKSVQSKVRERSPNTSSAPAQTSASATPPTPPSPSQNPQSTKSDSPSKNEDDSFMPTSHRSIGYATQKSNERSEGAKPAPSPSSSGRAAEPSIKPHDDLIQALEKKYAAMEGEANRLPKNTRRSSRQSNLQKPPVQTAPERPSPPEPQQQSTPAPKPEVTREAKQLSALIEKAEALEASLEDLLSRTSQNISREKPGAPSAFSQKSEPMNSNKRAPESAFSKQPVSARVPTSPAPSASPAPETSPQQEQSLEEKVRSSLREKPQELLLYNPREGFVRETINGDTTYKIEASEEGNVVSVSLVDSDGHERGSFEIEKTEL